MSPAPLASPSATSRTDLGDATRIPRRRRGAGHRAPRDGDRSVRRHLPVEVRPPALDELTRQWVGLIGSAAVARVAVEGERVVGGAVVGTDDEVPAGWVLRRLYVHPDRWGHGVGSRLHGEAVAAIGELGVRSLDVWVLERNAGARAFDERRGWSLVPGRVLRNDPSDVIDVMYELDLRRRDRLRR